MKVLLAKKKFIDHLAANGLRVHALTPKIGIEAIFAFYSDERAEGCPIEADGDMLLFEWGPNDWGDGAYYDVGITRQFLAANEEDPRQLTLTFRFDPSLTPRSETPGNRWCFSPAQLEEFRRFVSESRAMVELGDSSPVIVELRYAHS